jgi:hypothetical protein
VTGILVSADELKRAIAEAYSVGGDYPCRVVARTPGDQYALLCDAVFAVARKAPDT